MQNLLRITFILFRRSLAAGEFRTLLLALTIAVAALSSVMAISERVQAVLIGQANHLLAADRVLVSDQAIAPALRVSAERQGLAVASTAQFPSMVSVGEKTMLSSIKAVSAAYPLRGDLLLLGNQRTAAPLAGQVFIDQRVQATLGISIGANINVGQLLLRVAGILQREPDTSFDFSGMQPRVMMNDADLAASGLVGFGSRVKYRLLLAGDLLPLQQWQQQITLARGQHVEDVREARPELKDALTRAENVLQIAALLAGCLAAVAMVLAARRFSLRHYDSVALLRTFGASRRQVRAILLLQLSLLAIAAALAGGALGWLLQSVVIETLQATLSAAGVNDLPRGSVVPWLMASLMGLLLLLGSAGPVLMALADTPPLRVFRRELMPTMSMLGQWSVTVICLLGLLYWLAGDLKLALMIGAGVLAALMLSGAVGLLILRGMQSLLATTLLRSSALRIALRQLQRQRGLVVVQLGALVLGLMGMALLTVVQADLLAAWQKQIPANAPNHFAINIQADQAADFTQVFTTQQLPAPKVLPMIRGRWLALNGAAVQPEQFTEPRAKRLAEREFNLSIAPQGISEQGEILQGKPLQASVPAWSVEQGLAKTLGIKLGDKLTFDIAGIPVTAPVANLRKVQWESFRVNFFVMGSASLLQDQPTSLISSFYLPRDTSASMVAGLVHSLPNVTVIDVGQVLSEVQRVISVASSTLRWVFALCILAGLTVLIAALDTTETERRREAAIMRALGATTRRMAAVWWAESLLIGAIAGLIAGVCASATGWWVASQLLRLPEPVAVNFFLPLYCIVGGVGLAALTVWRRIRRMAATTPMMLLKE